ncbi:HNH endonuclease [Butyrivibrio sp. INlla21]|uniref:HNH endonuclease n=1 Tax=Butyrivibrio sp. INlla21 TaxID=1520811 RepID=UPI0008E1DE9E|nr:HNH endonuclease signature motif containing protein [Butyrivibrio sp. INlla21]SFU65803.1 HNH endonuclease [Butyrivibrio sp. INlla21]
MRGKKHKKRTIKCIILEKTGDVCVKCGKPLPLEKTTIDHLIPKYRGRTDELCNLIPMCKFCNKQKGSRIVGVEELKYLK